MTVTTPVPPAELAARVATVGGSPIRDILAVTARPEVINFAGGLPAPELFDADGIAAAFAHVLAADPRRALQYSTTEGEPALREALAARTTARSLPTTADDLLITTGSQQALSLLATALIEPGDTVLVENPCYLAALQTFGFAGAHIVPVPCDADGIDPDALDALAAEHRPKLLYTVPTFLRRACAVAKQAADLHTPTVNQLAAARYLAERDLDAHVAKVAAVYAARRDAMLAGIADALPEGSTWTRPEGGMFLWARLPGTGGYDSTALLSKAVAYEVAYVPGDPFHIAGADSTTLRLCFVTQEPEEIAEGLRRLGRALKG